MNRLSKKNSLVIFLVFIFCFSISIFASQDARELNRQAILAYKNGRYSEAKKLLDKAIKIDPNWAEPYFTYSEILTLTKKRAEKVRALKRAYEIDPKAAKYSEAYSKALREELLIAKKSKNISEINRLEQLIIKVNPKELAVGINIISKLFKNKKFADAKQLALDLLKKNNSMRTKYNSEEMGKLFYILAKFELKSKNYLQAKNYADNATKFSFADPDKPDRLVKQIKAKIKKEVDNIVDKADIEKENGNSKAAIVLLNSALKFSPENEFVQNKINELRSAGDAKAAFIDAKKFIEEKSWLEARDMLEYVVAQDPSHQEAKELLKKAEAIEEKLLKTLGRPTKLPRDIYERESIAKSYLTKGKQFATANNLTDARIAFEKGIAITSLDRNLKTTKVKLLKELKKIQDVNSKQELWEKGVEARNTGDYEECIKFLSKLPTNYDVQLPSYLADAYYQLDDAEKAENYARMQLRKQPENNRAKYILGCLFLDKGEKGRAYTYFKEIYDDDSSYPGLSDKLLKSGSEKWKLILPPVIILLLLWVAYVMWKKLPEYNKNAAIRRARKYLKQKFYDECIAELDKIKRLPNLTAFDGALISRLLAQAYLKKGIYDRAVGEAKHLLSINPKDQDAKDWLGYAFLGRRLMTPETLPVLLELYKKDSKNIALVSLLGSHYTKAKTLSQDGVNLLEQWLNLDPNNPEVLKPLGKYYLKKNRSDEKAMKVFQKMMDSASLEPEFLLGIAKIHLKLRQFDECLQLCEQVINGDVNNELVHSILREAYHKQNKLDDLMSIYQNFLQNNPYNVAFQKGLKDAQQLRDNVANNQQHPQPTAQTLACPNCHLQINQGDLICQNCGNPLS